MLNINKLEKAINEGKLNKAKLCSISGIARTTLDAILNGSDAKISTIEALTSVLNIKIGYLFDEEIDVRAAGRDYVERGKIEHNGSENYGHSSDTDSTLLRNEINLLREMIQDKNDRIAELKERIEELKAK